MNVSQKKHETVIDKPSIRIYVNKIENRITFKIKTGYYLESLTPETMKLLGRTKSNKIKDENSENVHHIEITDEVLVRCNNVNNRYKQDSRICYIFVPKKLFGQLLDISPENFMFTKTFNSEFLYIDVRFTDQNPKPLEIEDKVNIT